MQNIFKVLTESSFKSILKKYPDNIIITLFTKQGVSNDYTQLLFALSKKYQTHIFVYLNESVFQDKSFLSIVEKYPTFVFFYRNKRVLNIDSNFNNVHKSIDTLYDQINNAKKQLELKSKEIKEEPKCSYSDEYKNKLALLKKLYDLKKQGYTLLSTYTIDSEYDDMIWEYNVHTNPKNIIVEGATIDNDYNYNYNYITYDDLAEEEVVEEVVEDKEEKINKLLQLREQLCLQKNNAINTN